MRSGVLCFYRIGICIFLKRDSGLRRTSEEIFFLYTSNPSPKKLPYLRCLPYITNVTPRNATRHSRREVDIRFCFLFCQYFFQLPRPTGTSPSLIYDEQRERIENGISRFGTKIALYPSPLSHIILRAGEKGLKNSAVFTPPGNNPAKDSGR